MSDERYERSADMRLLELQRQAIGAPARAFRAKKYIDFDPLGDSSKDGEDEPSVPQGAVLVANLEAQPRRSLIAGAVVTISLSVCNDGHLPARGVHVTLPLPADTSYRPSSFFIDGKIVPDADATDLFNSGIEMGDLAPNVQRTVLFKIGVEAAIRDVVVSAHVSAASGAILGPHLLRLTRSFPKTPSVVAERPFYETDDGELPSEPSPRSPNISILQPREIPPVPAPQPTVKAAATSAVDAADAPDVSAKPVASVFTKPVELIAAKLTDTVTAKVVEPATSGERAARKPIESAAPPNAAAARVEPEVTGGAAARTPDPVRRTTIGRPGDAPRADERANDVVAGKALGPKTVKELILERAAAALEPGGRANVPLALNAAAPKPVLPAAPEKAIAAAPAPVADASPAKRVPDPNALKVAESIKAAIRAAIDRTQAAAAAATPQTAPSAGSERLASRKPVSVATPPAIVEAARSSVTPDVADIAPTATVNAASRAAEERAAVPTVAPVVVDAMAAAPVVTPAPTRNLPVDAMSAPKKPNAEPFRRMASPAPLDAAAVNEEPASPPDEPAQANAAPAVAHNAPALANDARVAASDEPAVPVEAPAAQPAKPRALSLVESPAPKRDGRESTSGGATDADAPRRPAPATPRVIKPARFFPQTISALKSDTIEPPPSKPRAKSKTKAERRADKAPKATVIVDDPAPPAQPQVLADPARPAEIARIAEAAPAPRAVMTLVPTDATKVVSTAPPLPAPEASPAPRKLEVVRSPDERFWCEARGGPVLTVAIDRKRVATLASLFSGASLGMIAHYLVLNALAVRDALPGDGDTAAIGAFVSHQEKLLSRALIAKRLGKNPSPDSLSAQLPPFPPPLRAYDGRCALDVPARGQIVLVRAFAPTDIAFLKRTLANDKAAIFLRSAQLFVGLCASDAVLLDDRERRPLAAALGTYAALATAEISRIFLRSKLQAEPVIFKPTDAALDDAARGVLGALGRCLP